MVVTRLQRHMESRQRAVFRVMHLHGERLRNKRARLMMDKESTTLCGNCRTVTLPCPAPDLETLYLCVKGERYAAAYGHMLSRHNQTSCRLCRDGGGRQCFEYKWFQHEYMDAWRVVVALALQGTRRQTFVPALTTVPGLKGLQIGQRWFMLLSPENGAQMRKFFIRYAVTYDELDALDKLYDVQRRLFTALHSPIARSVRWRSDAQYEIRQLASTVATLTSSVAGVAERQHALAQGEAFPGVEASGLYHEESALLPEESVFNGVPMATRHAVAQWRNTLTGADKCGVYWSF